MQKGRVLVYNISCLFIFLRKVLCIEDTDAVSVSLMQGKITDINRTRQGTDL